MFNQCVQKSVVSLSSKKTNLCQKCAYGDAGIRSSSRAASAAITLPQVLSDRRLIWLSARGVTMHQRPSLLVLALAAAPGVFCWSVVSHARPRWVRQRIGDVAMLEAYGACTPCCLQCGSKRLSRARAWRRSDAHRGLLEGSQPGRRQRLLRQHLTLVAGAARASAHAPTDAAAARARLGGRQLGLGWAQPVL